MVRENFCENKNIDHYHLICGPTGMIQTSTKNLNEIGYKYKSNLGAPNNYPLLPKSWIARLYKWNPFIFLWFFSILVCVVIWSYSRGVIGLNGKYCVMGFTNEQETIQYAY